MKKIKKCQIGTEEEQNNTTKKVVSPYVTDAQGTDFLKSWYSSPTTQKMLSEINTNMLTQENADTEKLSQDVNERINKGLSIPQYKAVYKEYPNGTVLSLPTNLVRSLGKNANLKGIDYNRIKSGSTTEERNNIFSEEVTKAYNKSNIVGSYDNNTKSVIYNPKYFNPSLQTHEVDHSIQSNVPETLETTQPVEYKLKEGVEKDQYLDNMKEVRSRIMEFRGINGLSPEKRNYTPEEAQKMLDNIEDSKLKDDLNRLDSSTLSGYLNFMASNNKYNRNDNLAKLGKNVAKCGKKRFGYSSTGERKKAKVGIDKQEELNEWTDKYFEKELSPENLQKLINKNNKISYLEVNPNIIGDSIIAGANIGNSIASYFNNKKTLKNLQSPKEPTYLNPIKYKTRININPQLNEINKEANSRLQSIKDNTKSSKVALNRMRQVQSDKADKLIDIYGKKENAETELINKNIESNATIDRYNNALANDYINRKTEFDNKITEAKGENTQALIQNLAGSVSNFMSSINKNNSELRNLNALSAGYENITPEYLKEKGIPYAMWLKQQRNKRNKR